MTSYRRPWWLVVNKSPGLMTTVQEIAKPGERVFVVRGEPLVQGLAWLTWGPVGALLAVLLLAGLAITLEMSERSWTIRGLFIAVFLGLPALAWGGTALVLTRLSEKYLQAERQAEAQECMIRLDQNQGELFYQTTAQLHEERLAYQDIRQARVTHAIGGRDGQALRLTIETSLGPVVLLNEALGSQAQKVDLVQEIQQALKSYLDKQKSLNARPREDKLV